MAEVPTETTPAPASASAPVPVAAAAAAAPPAKLAAKNYSTDPALYIYTSLTAGSSHIVTATSRLETILKANRVPFKAIDLATDQKARMLWGRRAGKDESGRVRKLPGLVQMGMVLGDLVEIEDWNEYGELKQHVKIYYDEFTIPAKGAKQIPNPLKRPIYGNSVATGKAAASASSSSSTPKPVPAAPPLPEKKEAGPTTTTGVKKTDDSKKAAVTPSKSIAEEAAQKAKQIRLDSLRAKVHGAAAAKEKEKEAAASSPSASKDGAGDEKKETTASTAGQSTTPANNDKESSPSGLTIAAGDAAAAASAAGLQSPTSGAWKTTSQEDSLRNVLQSPTSGTWKSGDAAPMALPIREHRGSSIVEASKEDIAAIEKAEAIPEAAVEDSDESEDDSDDDDDDDDDDDSEDSEEDDAKAEKK